MHFFVIYVLLFVSFTSCICYVFNHVLESASLLRTVIMIHCYGAVNTMDGIQASGQ